MILGTFGKQLMSRCVVVCLLGGVLAVSGCKPQEVTVVIKSLPADQAGKTSDGETNDGEPTGWGNVTGTIKVKGAVSPLTPLVMKGAAPKDPEVCGAETIPNEEVLVNKDNQGLANVVLFLDKPRVVKPELQAPPKEPVVFDQKGCRFFPHMLIVRVGQLVLVKSGDAVSHNTHNNPTRNSEFNKTIPINDRVGVQLKYTRPEAAPIGVKCDLHPWMKALHFPIDHPYVAVTDENGKYKIEGLPAGKHTFIVWHEKAQLLDRKLEVTIEPDKDTEKNVEYESSRFN